MQLQLEVGKYYRLENDIKAKCIGEVDRTLTQTQLERGDFVVQAGDFFHQFYRNGKPVTNRTYPIISEWRDPPSAMDVVKKFRGVYSSPAGCYAASIRELCDMADEVLANAGK